jgi:hypothetical protein
MSINRHHFYDPWDKRVQSVLLSRVVPITSRSNRCGIVFYFVYISWCVDRRPESKSEPHAGVRLAERDVASKLANSLSWRMIKYRRAKWRFNHVTEREVLELACKYEHQMLRSDQGTENYIRSLVMKLQLFSGASIRTAFVETTYWAWVFKLLKLITLHLLTYYLFIIIFSLILHNYLFHSKTLVPNTGLHI